MSAGAAARRVLVAYSGGLDTSWIVAMLTREAGDEVTTLFVDCGGAAPEETAELGARAEALGAVEHLSVDAREELFDRVVRWLIAGNVRRGGVYPLSVGAERGLQAEVLARVARDGGFDAVAHGCTAAGNDQIRFEAALATIAPELEVLAPVRDLGPTRAEELGFLERHHLPVPPGGGIYSVNAGLWGLTIGGGEMATAAAPLPEEAWRWTRGGGGEARITVGFEGGVPRRLDGEALEPVELVERLNREAGALGIGRGCHLGDTILGIKGRIGFEAPAAEVLLEAHRELEKLVLTEEQRFWKDHLGDVYGKRLHQGLFHDPFQRDLEAFFASSQERVTGKVHVRLKGGSTNVEGVESPFDLLRASDAVYGEEAGAEIDPAAALGLARTAARPATLWRRAGERARRAEAERQGTRRPEVVR